MIRAPSTLAAPAARSMQPGQHGQCGPPGPPRVVMAPSVAHAPALSLPASTRVVKATLVPATRSRPTLARPFSPSMAAGRLGLTGISLVVTANARAPAPTQQLRVVASFALDQASTAASFVVPWLQAGVAGLLGLRGLAPVLGRKLAPTLALAPLLVALQSAPACPPPPAQSLSRKTVVLAPTVALSTTPVSPARPAPLVSVSSLLVPPSKTSFVAIPRHR